MKPNFALHITDDSVALLHRTARGWLEIGASPLDTPDLGEAMSYLRRSALGLAPHGVATKIIIPNSQILYLTLDAPGPDDLNRDAQIRRALEGRTPYDVNELVFDWSGDGPHVQVAVVARETLQEAEDFAASFRLNPISFAALPGDARFEGEPWFGPSELAPSLLPEGEQVERDSEAVQILSRGERLAASAPEPQIDVPPEIAPDPAFAPEPEPAPAVAPTEVPSEDEPAVAPTEPEVPQAEPEPLWPEVPTPELPARELPEPETPEQPVAPPPELPAESPEVAPELAPELPFEAPPEFDAPPDEEEAPFIEIDFPDLTAADLDIPDLNLPDAPVAANGLQAMFETDAAETPVSPQVIPPVTAPAAGIAAAPSVAASFASRRRRAAKPGAAPVAEPPVTARKAPSAPLTPPPLSASAPAPRAYDLPGDPDNDPYDDPTLNALPEDDLPPALPPALAAARAAARQAPPALPSALARRAAQVAAAPARPAPKVAAPPRPAKGAQVTAPTIPGMGGRRVKPTPPPQHPVTAAAKPPVMPPLPVETLVAPPPAAMAEAAPFTPKARPARGKPRYLGLILTGILLLILVLIGAWSSIYLARSSDPAPEVEVAALPAADAAASDPAIAPITDIPSPEDEAAADGIAPEDVMTEPATAPAAPLPEAAGEAGAAPVLLPNDQDEIILSTMDQPPAALDALALEQPQTAADPAPVAPLPPPPFGTIYAFDANGLIKPTVEGIVTPEGYNLVAGPPPILPPQRPASIAALAPTAVAPDAAALAEAADTTPEAAAAAPPVADPALSGFRPRARPAGLVPAPADDAALAPPVDSRLASVLPRARPQSIVAAAEARRLDEEAQRVAEAASLSAAAAAQALAETAPQEDAAPKGPISPQAVAISRLPPQKPRNFSKAVEAALAEAAAPRATVKLAEPEPEPAPEEPKRTARKAVPGEDEEPEVAAAAAAPKVPSKASVAKNATFVNAIDLGKTNLIGVYGTPAKRYALIRTSAGKYKKVRVGDRIDGGTIAAITDDELRYKKGGRMVTLAMPRG
ncbi:hypothetical protein SAMN04488103_10478 [Gemmobacter aquatilis]|uniref:Type IV pilus biogenesis protein PilP n=1 Tax=Gemmobacter aquatilis TaxID=933059 RepID=A0A1H8F8C5_9RHOB|nr:hypothetical protein [Gemmobacter aquatilis]SEN27447.1 hypothetical protein SAMN04488103_10478 [Gemmobacter aquatilis]